MGIDELIDSNGFELKMTDNRGRITLGSEYGGRQVLIKVLDEEDVEDIDKTSMNVAASTAAEARSIIDRLENPTELFAALHEENVDEVCDLTGISRQEAEDLTRELQESMDGSNIAKR